MLMFEETTPGARSWPLTPPNSSDPPAPKDVSSVVTAIHVISTERAALAHLEHIYQTDARAQHDLARAVDQIARSVREGGKLVVCGVGKSGKVGRKIEATMNSLGVYSAFLHPTEALHGDLGLVRPVSPLAPADTTYVLFCFLESRSHLAFDTKWETFVTNPGVSRMIRFFLYPSLVAPLSFYLCFRIFPGLFR